MTAEFSGRLRHSVPAGVRGSGRRSARSRCFGVMCFVDGSGSVSEMPALRPAAISQQRWVCCKLEAGAPRGKEAGTLNCKHGLESQWCSLCQPTAERRQGPVGVVRRRTDSRSTKSIVDLTVGSQLDIRVDMSATNHVSKKTDLPCYWEREQFSWREKDWTLRFLATPKESQPVTTY